MVFALFETLAIRQYSYSLTILAHNYVSGGGLALYTQSLHCKLNWFEQR